MAENTISVRLVECAKTLDEWIELGSRVIPKKGEICLEYFNAGTDSDPIYRYKMKIGDGVHQYSQLKYFPVPEDITNSIVTWVEANLDVNEYAQAAIRNVSGVNYIDISSIKEVDGKISGGTSLKFTVSAGNMLSINYNEASRTATISHNTITQNDTAGGDVSSGVITSISRDTSGHVTGVQKGTIPSSPDVSTVVAEGRTSTSDTSIRVDEPYINQLRGGGVRSSHQLKNGDNISVSSLRQGNYTDIVISHGSAGAGTESGTTDSGNQLNFGSNVVTGVTRDSKGHVTGVTTSSLPNSPSAPEVRSSVTVDNQSVVDSNTNVVNPFVNQVLNGHVTSSHKVEGGTKINVSASPDGDNHLGNKVVIEHSTTTRQPDTEDSTSPTEVITGVTTDGTGHVTGVSFTSPDNLKVGLAKDLDYPITSIDDGNMWNDRVTGGDISIGEDAAKLNPLKGNTIVWNQQVPVTASSNTINGVTFTNNGDGSWTINGTASAETSITLTESWAYFSGHYYLFYIKSPSNNIGISTNGYSNWQTTPKTVVPAILKCINSLTNRSIYLNTGTGESFANVRIVPMIFDLTKKFGSDEQIASALGITVAEITTDKAVQAFEKLFPLPYYDYNEGELISLGGNPQIDPSLYVDMGLPSGTLWAKSNIDLTQPNKFAASPYQYECSFFSWGNVDGHNPINSSSFDYNWGSVNAAEPWYDEQPYGQTSGSKLTSDIPVGKAYDAARANLGPIWKMPSSVEFQELFDNCIFVNADGTEIPSSTANKRVTVNGIVGLYLQSKANGNRLFFACSGYGGGSSWGGSGSSGYYRSASFYSASRARVLFFYSDSVGPQSDSYRYYGFPIRPVLSNNHNFSIKSIGFNQWDEEWELGTIDDATGGNSSVSDRIRSKGYISVLSGQTYYAKNPLNMVVHFYDAEKGWISKTNGLNNTTFDIPTNAKFIRFRMIPSYGTTYNNDICINISDSSRNGTYEPYKKHTLDLDWIKTLKDSGGNLLFPNGLCSAGSVYDEVGEDYAIKRVGAVDLGDLNYTQSAGVTGVTLFISQLADKKLSGESISSKFIRVDSYLTVRRGPDLMWMSDANESIVFSASEGQYSSPNSFKDAMQGVMLYYELATPITIHFNKKSMYYVVDDKGTEQLLPVNDADPVTAPIRGSIEYKSNFKEVVLNTIDRVNNYKNPVRGVNNTSQNIGSVAVYDSDSTVHSSEYTISNATIIADDTSNSTTIPSIRAIVAYVQNVGQNALHYKGVISSYAELMRVTDAVPGDVWILSQDDSSSVPNKVYDAGDWFIRNVSNTGWDEIQGKVRVNNRNAALTLNGQRKILANIEGTDITVDVPNLNFTSQSASGTTITVVEDVSQSDGLISATRKTIRSASKTATGIVQFVSNIHNSTDDTKAVTAGDAWTEFSKRNVRALEVSTITEVPVSVNVFIATFPPSVSTPPENWAPSMGVWTGAAHFVGQLYIDTRAGIAYIAVSTNNINGWKQITNS